MRMFGTGRPSPTSRPIVNTYPVIRLDKRLAKWEKWLEQSLKQDTGYPKIKVTVLENLKQDVNVERNGDVFEIEINAVTRNDPKRFKVAYDSALRAILARSPEQD
jgi:hypothetical protein